MTNLAMPFHFDGQGRTASATREAHIRNLIEQVLFTSPGERVNRPDFGSGLMQLVFAPNSDELAATAQFIAQSALQEWLGDLIQVQSVAVDSDEAVLRVTVDYIVREDQQRHQASFTRGGATR